MSQHHDEIEEAGASTERVEASCWSTIGEYNEEEDEADESLPEADNNLDPMMPSQELELVLEDLKMRLQDQDLQLQSGEKIYNKMKTSALMASCFHNFGSLHGGTVTNIQGGGVRPGRHIPVQATASGRHKLGTNGKAPAPSGRPATLASHMKRNPRYELLIRRKPHNDCIIFH